MLPVDGLHLHLVDLAETTAVADRATARLPDTDLTSVARHRGARRRVQAAVSRLLTRAVLGHEDVPITTDEWGRPVTGDGACVNVSHDDGVVVLLAAAGPCGVDVADNAEADLRDVVGRFCGPDERPVSARQWWAAKESAAKAIGRGLRAGLSTIRFDGDPGAGWSSVTWRGERLPLRTRTFDLGERHLALTATTAGAPAVEVHAWRPATAQGRWWLEPAARTSVSAALTSELSQGRG